MKLGAIILPLAMTLAACEAPARVPAASPFAPIYEGIETELMTQELVLIKVKVRGPRKRSDVTDYARCAAARYTLLQGYGFARHLRTNIEEEGGVWRADAVYTISPSLPRGLRTIDAEVVTADCAANDIPTV